MPIVNRLTRVAVAVAALGAAAPVRAAGENGIKIGEGRLHLSIDVEGRYDSNVLYAFGGAPVEDVVLHLRPGLQFGIDSPSTLVAFDALLDWAKYLGVSDPATKDLSNVYGRASLALALNRNGQVGLDFSDAYRRSDETRSYSIPTAVVTNYNDLRLGVPWRPGGGALAVTFAGEWLLETFEPLYCGPGLSSCTGSTLSRYGYNQVSGGVDARWSFLPRTAAVLEASYFERIPNDTAVSLQLGGLKALVGLVGLVTPHLQTMLKAGYGDTFGSAGVPYRTWLLNAELAYLSEGVGEMRVGYAHTYASDPGVDFALYGMHRVYASGKLRLGRINAKLEAEWDHLQYVLVPVDGDVYRVVPAVEFLLLRWLTGEVAYAYSARRSSTGSAIPAYDFSKSEAWLRLTAAY